MRTRTFRTSLLAVITILLLCSFTPQKGMRILFIGDSITDGGWGNSGGKMSSSAERNHKDMNHIYGHSFMMLCAAQWQSDYPHLDLQFMNRGISGNTLNDIAARWPSDALALSPDVVCLLVGINDVYAFRKHRKTDVAAEFDFEAWEKRYTGLLDTLRRQNPDVRIMLGTPFVTKEGGRLKEKDYHITEQTTHRLAETVRRIAQKYDAALLPFDEMFYELTKEEPRRGYWIWDGIHPTPAGHHRMADLWLRTAEAMP